MDQNLNSWNNYFWLKNDGEKWSRIFYFEILRAPSEIPANLPGQLGQAFTSPKANRGQFNLSGTGKQQL